MRTLFDESGTEIEVPDENELKDWKERAGKVSKLEEDLKIHEGGKGVQNLREVLGRKEESLAELTARLAEREAKLAELGQTVKEEYDPKKVAELTAKTVQEQMTQMEVQRSLANFDEDQKKVVKRYFDKLTSGETVDMSNVHTFLKEAETVAFPTRSRQNSNASFGGRAAMTKEETGKFGDSDAGKAFAKSMGMMLEKPEAKK